MVEEPTIGYYIYFVNFTAFPEQPKLSSKSKESFYDAATWVTEFNLEAL